MKDGFMKAEKLIKGVIEALSNTRGPRDGEDLTCYNHSCLDSLIIDLVNAKTFMASDGRYKELT